MGERGNLLLERRKVLEVGKHTGLVMCGRDDLPPTTWPEEELGEWTPTGEVLEFDLGVDGWKEGWVMARD